MNLKQKIYLITIMERMYPSWYDYKHAPVSDLSDVPESYREAYALSDVCVKDECNIAMFEGACSVLGLVAVLDTKKWELRVETKKGRVLLLYNGESGNYNLEELSIKYIEKYGIGEEK